MWSTLSAVSAPTGGRMPTYTRPRTPHQLGQIAGHILGRVEMLSADSAANEQVAGRLLHPSRRLGIA